MKASDYCLSLIADDSADGKHIIRDEPLSTKTLLCQGNVNFSDSGQHEYFRSYKLLDSLGVKAAGPAELKIRGTLLPAKERITKSI